MDNLPNPVTPPTLNQPSEWLEPGHPVQNPQPPAAAPQIPPPNIPPAPVQPFTNTMVGFPQKKKGGGFSIFVILSILLLLGVWGFVGYLYYQNQTLTPKKAEV